MSEQTIFTAALEKDPQQRAAFLDQVCAGDADLRERVEKLLRLHQQAGDFMESPAATCLTVEQPLLERPGTQIGPYKLLQQIGEGGMGVVYMAGQEQPVRRRVALKIIKPGMDTRQVIARFEAERQALALMDHPNIARVLDGGTTDAGRPYFVMDLVRGVPITQHCDDHRLTPRQRLELFLPVCHAIQHAHQKGIIHRDLKPSNVLVALYDGRPVPKVIDFGVAKAAGQPLTEQTLVTGFGAIVGTLEYMSPEQAEINQLDIDTRSDIYSLGVLLYELLTGSPPFSRKDLEKAGLLEMLRVIREQEPTRPSTKLSTAEGLPILAANRGTGPDKLTKVVRGELDWIVMKALEKDRTRRYETATGFAQDVQRYLHDEPVLACPPSAGYRLRKFIRRKKRALATAAVLGVTVMVAIGGVAWSVGWANRDREARQAAVDQEVDLALKEAERLGEQGKWPEALSAVLRADGLLAGGASEALRERVRELRRDVEMVLRLEDARVQGIGHAKNDFFDRDAVDAAYKKAFADYGIDVETLPADRAAELIRVRRIRLQLAWALDAWALEGTMQWGVPQPSPVEPRRDKLLAISRAADSDELRNRVRDALQTPRVGPEYADHLVELARSPRVRALPPSTLCALANALPLWGRDQDAVALLRDAQQRHPDDFWINYWLAGRLWREGHEGIRFFSAALALRPNSIAALEGLGFVLGFQGKHDEAAVYFTKAAELQPQCARAHVNLGAALRRQGKLDKAVECFRKAIELDPESVQAYAALGSALEAKGQRDDAIASFKKAFELQPNSAITHDLLGDALAKVGRLDEALAMDQQAVELDPKNGIKLTNLGSTLKRLGRLDEAIDCYQKAIAINPTDSWASRGLVSAFCDKGQVDEAIATSQKAHEVARYYFPEDDAMNRVIRQAVGLKTDDAEMRRYGLGGTFAQLGRWKDAAAAFDRELEVNPTNHERWCLAAAVHAATADLEGYRRTCRGMLKHFGDSYQPQTAERTVKACLLLPDALSAADFDRVQKLAERAVAGTEKDIFYRYFVLAKGLADYRAGRHADAIKWLERFPPNADGTHWDATKFAVLATAEHGRGRAQEAQASLAKAKAILAKMPDPAKGQPFDAGNWHDWGHAQVLCREAEEMMKKGPGN